MEDIEAYLRAFFVVKIEGIREKIAKKRRNTANVNGAGDRIRFFPYGGNAVFQDPQCLVHVLIEFLTVFGKLDSAALFLE